MREFGFRAQGSTGELRVGYQVAVKLRDWFLTCSQSSLGEVGWGLEAFVEKADEFWSTQPPTEIRLLMQPNVWWVWQGLAIRGTPSRGSKIEAKFNGGFAIR